MANSAPGWDGQRVWHLRVQLGGKGPRQAIGLNAIADQLKREARERFGVDAGWAGSTVARWEDGTVEPPYVALLIMAGWAGLPFDEFALGAKPWEDRGTEAEQRRAEVDRKLRDAAEEVRREKRLAKGAKPGAARRG